MKLDENKSTVKVDSPEIVRQAKKQLEYKKIGDHMKKIDGGRIWKISKEDNKVSEALYRTQEEYCLKAGQAPPSILDIEKGYWYVEALNAKNAARRKQKGQIILST